MSSCGRQRLGVILRHGNEFTFHRTLLISVRLEVYIERERNVRPDTHSCQNKIKTNDISVSCLFAMPLIINEHINRGRTRCISLFFHQPEARERQTDTSYKLFPVKSDDHFLLDDALLQLNECFVLRMSHVDVSIFFVVEG